MNDFKPTEGQAKALDIIRGLAQKHPNGGGLAIIAGYAGTGKTTLIRVLAQENPTLFVLTPTGKAAVRVKEAAGCDAKTIHSWMYSPRKNEITGSVNFICKNQDELLLPPNRTLIVDEASMISEKVFTDLWMFVRALGLNLVLIGDGFQLAPVEADPEKQKFSVFNIQEADRVELTEVLRQALESPIIRVSTRIRTESDMGAAIHDLNLIPERDLERHLAETFMAHGAIICHKNRTRQEINSTIRRLRGLPADILQTDEPLLVLRNNYELDVFNGEVFTIEALQDKHGPYPIVDRYKNKTMFMTFQEVVFRDLPNSRAAVSLEEVFGKSGDMDPDSVSRGIRSKLKETYRDREECVKPTFIHTNLGYALTCHKSQGSEWPVTLVVVEDSVKTSTLEGRRWFYTALTRARDSVKVCWL